MYRLHPDTGSVVSSTSLLYREYHELDGESNATGNDYVVNYMSGECYRAEKQEDKSFKLYAIEQPENGQE